MPFDGTLVETTPTAVADPITARLTQALAYLRQQGWCQRVGHREGRRCLVSAIYGHDLSISSAPWVIGEVQLAVCRLGFFGGPADAIRWNDQPGRTLTEVTARLEAALQKEPANVV